MKTEQSIRLYTKLLQITAKSRFNIMRRIWNIRTTGRSADQDIYKDALCELMTGLRDELHSVLTSDEMQLEDPMIDNGYDIASKLRQDIGILFLTGMDEECIADLLCVSKVYVRMCMKALKEEIPDLFG